MPLPAEPVRPSLSTKLGYSVGNLGKSVVWTSFENFMLFYLVSIARLPPMLAGMLLALAMLWDGLFDLCIALWADARGRGDRLGRLIGIGAPLCAAGFWAIFAADAPGTIAAAIMLCRIGYSLCDVGHNTLLVRVARHPDDATTVSGLRLIFSACGAGLVALASGWSLTQGSSAARQAAFAGGAPVGALLYLATLMAALVATRHLAAPHRHAQRMPPWARVRSPWQHPPYRHVLTVIAIQAGMVPLFLRTLPFFGQAVHHDAGWAGPALATVTLGQSLSLPLWMALSRRRSPDAIARTGHGLAISAMIGLAIGSHGVAGSVLLLALGVAQAATNIAIWAMLALAVQRTASAGPVDEATSVGLFLAVLKGAAALGTLVSASVVASTAASATGTNDAPSLAACVLLIPVAGCVLALAVLRDRDFTAES